MMFGKRSRERKKMKLDSNQLKHLINLVVSAKADKIGCDGCFELMDQLAQADIDGLPLSEHLTAVREHLDNCKCCRDEYAALLTALRAIEE